MEGGPMEIINRKPWKYRVFYSFHAGCAQPMEIINRKPANFQVSKTPRIRPSPELKISAISKSQKGRSGHDARP